MKTKYLILSIILFMGNSFEHLFAFPNAVEITKISIKRTSEKEMMTVESTQNINIHRTNDGQGRYIRVPEVHRGAILSVGDIIEAFEKISARIDFPEGKFVFLGPGAEEAGCSEEVMVGESCAMARFEGFLENNPFLYIKKGGLYAKNVVMSDDRAVVKKVDGEYYVYTTKAKTTVIARRGAVQVIAKNVPQEVITVSTGESVEILSPDTPPTRPVKVSPDTLRDIDRWIRSGLLVIQKPTNGTTTRQSVVPLSGIINEPKTPTILVRSNAGKTWPLRLEKKGTDGEFGSELDLQEGQNHFDFRASTYYGDVEERLSITRRPPQGIPVPMPDVRGKTAGIARVNLANEGFHQVTIHHQPTNRGPQDTVVDQAPPPHTAVLLNTPITLVVEHGQFVPVPNVIGHTSAQAKQHLQNSGLTAGSISKQITKRGRVGTIVGQSLEPYTRVPPGTTVTLIEAQEQLVQVPNVQGKSLKAAAQLLEQHGLQVGKTTGERESGTVVMQLPTPSAEVPLNTKVDIELKDVGKETREAMNRIRPTAPTRDSFNFTSRRDPRLQTGKTRITIENRSNYTFSVHFLGSEAQTIKISKGNSREVVLVSGDYEVAGVVNHPRVKPFYARHTFRANYHYDYTLIVY